MSVSKEEKKLNFSLIVVPNFELGKLHLKNINWSYLQHLDSMEDEADFESVCRTIKEFTNLKET